MKVSLTFTDFQEALEEFQHQTGAAHQFGGIERQLILPKFLGEGRVHNIHLREGLDLFMQEHCLMESLSIDFLPASPDTSQVTLKFCLSGVCSGEINGTNTELCVATGHHLLAYCPDMSGTVDLGHVSTIRTIEILISPTLFNTMMGESESPLGALQQSFHTNKVSPYWQIGKTNTLMTIALQQILRCPFQGSTRRLYLESKVLELIVLYLEQLKDAQLAPPKSRPLKPEDVQRIHQARDILIRQIDNPPSLLSLARQVGINDCKLKQAFRQVFGTTVFGYLHNHRMERAAQLLQENQLTVTGVASAVGFANRSSFAAAFRRKFGVNPSDYLAAYKKHYWTISPKTPASVRQNSG